jgi:hypothetical protein
VSAPWWHPEANPLADVRAFKRQAEREYLSCPFVPVLTPEEEALMERLRRGEAGG